MIFTRKLEVRLDYRNACYFSVQNILSSCLISKNIKINIKKTVILPVVCMGAKPWSLTLRRRGR
jgi:hypothetical protein